MARPPPTPPTSPSDHAQPLRVRRFVLASTASASYLVVLAAFHAEGRMDRATLVAAAVIVAVLVLVFSLLFRFRLNLRFADPSLTAYQVLAAVFTMLYVVFHAPQTRLVFATYFFVAMMFGMLRTSGTQLSMLGALSLLSFGIVAGWRHVLVPDPATLRDDALQLVVMALTFPWFVVIGRRLKRLREADRHKDEFLASLAHELRNPLAPIRTGVDLLRTPGMEVHAAVVLPMIERQVQHMTRLLDDLLDVSRISRGKIALHLETVELRQALDAALESVRPQFAAMRHELIVTLPPTPVRLRADPVRLAQILANLLNNAAKYTPREGRIVLAAEVGTHVTEISVRDNGVGIPAEDLDAVFGMFTQVGSHAPYAQGGLGIGLWLVRRLVELHDGTIEVRSAGPGHGTEFRVRLPTGRAVEPVSPGPSAQRTSNPSLRVLVVDDNRDAATSLALLLRSMGHDVQVAHDGESGAHIAEAWRPDAVLLDLGMPRVDGFETCRRIRAQAWSAATRVIAVTGWGQDDDRRRSQAAGFDEHLVKPVSPATLESVLGRTASPAVEVSDGSRSTGRAW